MGATSTPFKRACLNRECAMYAVNCILSISFLVPGPTSYTDPRTALEAPKKLSSLKKCPFNQTALRFDPHPTIRSTPGPGQYNLVGLAAESVKKAYFASTTKGKLR